MTRDKLLTKETAQVLHNECRMVGLVMWTVTHNTADYGERWVARPFIIAGLPTLGLDEVLVADTLEELHQLLPAGLVRLHRDPDDDPVIVEVWF